MVIQQWLAKLHRHILRYIWKISDHQFVRDSSAYEEVSKSTSTAVVVLMVGINYEVLVESEEQLIKFQ